jgi:predicted chitinase
MRSSEFVSERRRRRKAAVYGPGPFGGYGYATGYSGDGGSVGEASYEGNIGAMELAKFFRIADDQQKKLLKELIAKNKKGLAWKLIQDVVGVKLQGPEFNGMYEDSYTAEDYYTTEKQILTRIRQIMYDRRLSGTESNAGELLRLKQQLKDLRSQQGVAEGWRDWIAGAALGAAALGANAEVVKIMPGQTVYSIARAFGTDVDSIKRSNPQIKDITKVPAGTEIKIPVKFRDVDTTANPSKKKIQPSLKPSQARKIDTAKTLTKGRYESVITQAARQGGITDPVELAAFLAQVSVETGGFDKLKEQGDRRYISRMYDPKYNPAGADAIGNTKVGDGWRFRGRGFLQITGRYNYREAGKAMRVNLIKNPEALLDPTNAARASVWYWKWRVRPNITDFNDTKAITRLVQGGDKHLDRRERAFAEFKQFFTDGNQVRMASL